MIATPEQLALVIGAALGFVLGVAFAFAYLGNTTDAAANRRRDNGAE